MKKDHPAQVYRHFNQDGKLLYVGCSHDACARLGGHRVTSSWFKQIATVTIQHFDRRSDALEAEKEAVLNEHPVYNKPTDPAVEKYDVFKKVAPMLHISVEALKMLLFPDQSEPRQPGSNYSKSQLDFLRAELKDYDYDQLDKPTKLRALKDELKEGSK